MHLFKLQCSAIHVIALHCLELKDIPQTLNQPTLHYTLNAEQGHRSYFAWVLLNCLSFTLTALWLGKTAQCWGGKVQKEDKIMVSAAPTALLCKMCKPLARRGYVQFNVEHNWELLYKMCRAAQKAVESRAEFVQSCAVQNRSALFCSWLVSWYWFAIWTVPSNAVQNQAQSLKRRSFSNGPLPLLCPPAYNHLNTAWLCDTVRKCWNDFALKQGCEETWLVAVSLRYARSHYNCCI